MNKVRDYKALEREFIRGDMSLRELCRLHGITAHSAVMVQARAGDWAEKRQTYRTRASAKYIEARADRDAIRESEVRDHAIEAIDEAITRFRSDLRATKQAVLRDGSIVEEPVVRITPRDLALVIDRFNVLFARPSNISEERNLSVSAGALPIEGLKDFIDLTRGLADTRTPQESPLPRRPGDAGDAGDASSR